MKTVKIFQKLIKELEQQRQAAGEERSRGRRKATGTRRHGKARRGDLAA